MIKRYTPWCMSELWSNKSKYYHWLEVELAVLEAKSRHGKIASEVFEAFRDNATFTVERIDKLDAKFHHDLIAFVETVRESMVAAGYPKLTGEFHNGITSYDTEDPALMLQLRTSVKHILTVLWDLRNNLLERAEEHKFTLMIARTHGQFAEPDTFGRLLLDFVGACDNHIRRLEYISEEELGYSKLSGAIGNYAGLDPELEKEALTILGLKPVNVSTQIVNRSQHATYTNELANIAGTLQRLAETLWIMSQGLAGEVCESRAKDQKGSSAMPHKKNPIILERIKGMARIVRACASMILESVSTPECRDIAQSCVERVAFPDATSVVCYMLEKMAKLIKGLEVFPNIMRENLDKTFGTWAGGRIKTALLNAGTEPNIAYDHIQLLSFRAVDKRIPLVDLLLTETLGEDEQTVADIIGTEQLHQLFDPEAYIKDGIEVIFDRFAA